MNAWLCPRCKAIVFYGHQTMFGRLDEASAMLNHIEARHPDWAAELESAS